MVCYPCQRKRIQGIYETPFKKGAERDDITKALIMRNDHKNAYQHAGKELGEYVL